MVGLLALAGTAGAARADIAALFADGHGGIESGGGSGEANGTSSNQSGANAGLGYRLGARLLIFEGYYDHTGFGDGAGVTRGIVGLRGGFGSNDVRLVLRAGAGVVEEQGGALTERLVGMPDRRGPVGRVGAALEGRVAPMLLVGFGVDAETFELPAMSGAFGSMPSTVGSDIFANLHLMFELGV
ncbi:MAG TPA: hypothetical protein VIF57_14935 [Polyangia bacterium]